ncbi:MAG: hypothetical protein HC892_01455 [Saprospiraceae bacterium]|nr:hypothetical protein [Saprospiraceae bacterium]
MNSQLHSDKSIIFAEYFRDRESVLKNKYANCNIAGNPKIGNGIILNGITDKLIYNRLTFNSIRFVINPTINNQQIVYINATQNISINNSNQIIATGFSYPTYYYVNGVNTQALTIGIDNDVVIVTSTKIRGVNVIFGQNTTYYKGSIKFIESYNRILTVSEVKCIHQGILYVDPTPELDCLLDLTAERGFIEDRTSKNKINNTNVAVKKKNTNIMYLNGTDSRLRIPMSDHLKVNNLIVSIWVNRTKKVADTHLFGTWYGTSFTAPYFNWNIQFNYQSPSVWSSIAPIAYVPNVKDEKWVNLLGCFKSGHSNSIQVNNNPRITNYGTGVFDYSSNQDLILSPHPYPYFKGNVGSIQIFDIGDISLIQVDELFARIYNSQKGKYGL